MKNEKKNRIKVYGKRLQLRPAGEVNSLDVGQSNKQKGSAVNRG